MGQKRYTLAEAVKKMTSRAGSVSTPKKAAAARKNGKKGGRPRKAVA